MEQQEPKPKAKKTSKPKLFSKRLYIPGYGMVDVGDEITKEAEAAWNKKTKVPIKNYTQ